jgi:hypothetical protein
VIPQTSLSGASFTMLTGKILHLKITHLKLFFNLYFCLIFIILIQAWHLKIKTIILLHKIVCISQEEISKTYVNNASELCE